jgi:hypothetical protein
MNLDVIDRFWRIFLFGSRRTWVHGVLWYCKYSTLCYMNCYSEQLNTMPSLPCARLGHYILCACGHLPNTLWVDELPSDTPKNLKATPYKTQHIHTWREGGLWYLVYIAEMLLKFKSSVPSFKCRFGYNTNNCDDVHYRALAYIPLTVLAVPASILTVSEIPVYVSS